MNLLSLFGANDSHLTVCEGDLIQLENVTFRCRTWDLIKISILDGKVSFYKDGELRLKLNLRFQLLEPPRNPALFDNFSQHQPSDDL